MIAVDEAKEVTQRQELEDLHLYGIRSRPMDLDDSLDSQNLQQSPLAKEPFFNDQHTLPTQRDDTQGTPLDDFKIHIPNNVGDSLQNPIKVIGEGLVSYKLGFDSTATPLDIWLHKTEPLPVSSAQENFLDGQDREKQAQQSRTTEAEEIEIFRKVQFHQLKILTDRQADKIYLHS